MNKKKGRPRTLPDAEPRPCKGCGKAFTPIRKKWKQQYCSQFCQRSGRIWHRWKFIKQNKKVQRHTTSADFEPRKCKYCGESFVPLLNPKQIFCSQACRILDNGNLSRRTAKQRGNKQRGRGEGKTYRKLNGRHEHRIVAEKILGRPLKKGEIVHHKDNNKFNNDPLNLMVMSQSEHIKIHKHDLLAKRKRTSRIDEMEVSK